MESGCFPYQYKQLRSVDCRFSIVDPTVPIQTIILLGTVQIGNVPRWVAEHSPPGTVIIQGAPHWHTHPSGKDIPDMMSNYTQQAISYICRKYPVHTVNLITDSQAAPPVINAIARNLLPVKINHLALVQPLGFNRSSYIHRPASAITLLYFRFLINVLRQTPTLITDPKLRYNYRQIACTVPPHSKKTRSHYTAGLRHSVLEDLRRCKYLWPHITVVCGERDTLFPPKEVIDNLQKAHIDIQVRIVPRATHTPLSTAHGRKLLRAAFAAGNIVLH